MFTENFEIILLFFAVISFCLWMYERFYWVKKVSLIMLILFVCGILGNVGIIPTRHVVYDTLNNYCVPLAVVFILLGVRISDLKKTGWPMLCTFMLASIASFIGCLLGGIFLYNWFESILQADAWKVVGPYIGTYIGGSINFFALWQGLEIHDQNLFVAANAVDNITFFPIFLFWVLATEWLSKYMYCSEEENYDQQEQGTEEKFILPHIINLFLLAFCIIYCSNFIKTTCHRIFPDTWITKIPSILYTTTFAIILAQFSFIQKWQGTKNLSNLAFYLFFCSVGAMIDIKQAISLAPILFVFVLIVIVVQILIVLIFGKLFRIDLRMIATCSIAAKLGPSSVMAFTNTKQWHSLVLPGMAAALLGYAIGNYFGFAGAYLLKFIMQ
ncbi:MAG TPA: DUF819 family protein [Planctomycetota bacterium]|nr:DUF819 family protein [Planctomycetota bacterium]